MRVFITSNNVNIAGDMGSGKVDAGEADSIFYAIGPTCHGLHHAYSIDFIR